MLKTDFHLESVVISKCGGVLNIQCAYWSSLFRRIIEFSQKEFLDVISCWKKREKDTFSNTDDENKFIPSVLKPLSIPYIPYTQRSAKMACSKLVQGYMSCVNILSDSH